MKSLILFALSLSFITATYAKDRSSSTKQKIDALEFFETLWYSDVDDEENNRNPNWPKQLTIEPIESISEKDAYEMLQGTWRMVYHCSGQPALTFPRYFDGKKNRPYREVHYKDGQITFQSEDRPELTRTYAYSITRLDDEKFSLKYDKQSDIISFVRIKETGQIAIHTSQNELRPYCPDRKKVQTLEIRLHQNLM